MDILKIAYDIGLQRAYTQSAEIVKEAKDFQWPWAPKEPESPWKSWKPYALGAGLGLAGYGLLKHPFKANALKYPELRKIQDQAAGDFSHVMIDPPDAPEGFLEKLWEPFKWGPHSTPVKRTGAIRKEDLGTPNNPKVLLHGFTREQPTGMMDPSLGAAQGADATARYDKLMAFEDKLEQYKLLSKYAPGTMGKTISVEDILKKKGLTLSPDMDPAEIRATLAKVQEAAREEFGGKEYIIKPRNAREGGDPSVQSTLYTFPHEKSDLADLWDKWQPHKKQFYNMAEKDPGAAVATYREAVPEAYPGRVSEEMLHNNAIFQEKQPIQRYFGDIARAYEEAGFAPTKDYRVHSFGGYANPSLADTRFDAEDDIVSRIKHWWTSRRAARWAQENVINKLPPELRGLSYGIDVAPLTHGPQPFSVMEMNPIGGQSGILDYPQVERNLYRHFTGRSTESWARAGGVAAGVAGTGLAGGGMALHQKLKGESDE
jgi:hypothetical protein